MKCPLCRGRANTVASITVRHLVKSGNKDRVKDENYGICLEENCDVVYFTADTIFRRNDLKVDVWYKKDADPKYICYCSRVTEGQIVDAVVNRGAKSFKEVVGLTGAMKNCRCEENNPLGKCCSPHIIETIRLALKMKAMKTSGTDKNNRP